VTKIVVGANSGDYQAAANIKKYIMQRWFTPIITDTEVTTSMLSNETLILVGAWVPNAISKVVNDSLLHYTAGNGVILDENGNSLGPYVVMQIANYVIIWGYSGQDTLNAASAYIRKEGWKVPVVIATAGAATASGIVLLKRAH
jgi:hypothetical protein